MDPIIIFFRDTISGFSYFVYAMILIFLILADIGYLVTQACIKSKMSRSIK